MSDNHDLLNDNEMCSFSGHEAEDLCFNYGDHACGDSLFADSKSKLFSEYIHIIAQKQKDSKNKRFIQLR